MEAGLLVEYAGRQADVHHGRLRGTTASGGIVNGIVGILIAAVDHHPGIGGQTGFPAGGVQGIVGVADRVHHAQFQGFRCQKDACGLDLFERRRRRMTVALHQIMKAFAQLVGQILNQRGFLGGAGTERRARILVCTGFVDLHGHPDLVHKVVHPGGR